MKQCIKSIWDIVCKRLTGNVNCMVVVNLEHQVCFIVLFVSFAGMFYTVLFVMMFMLLQGTSLQVNCAQIKPSNMNESYTNHGVLGVCCNTFLFILEVGEVEQFGMNLNC